MSRAIFFFVCGKRTTTPYMIYSMMIFDDCKNKEENETNKIKKCLKNERIQ